MLKSLSPDPTLLNQTFTMTIDPDGITTAVRVELRHLDHTDKWYISIYSAATGECFVRYIPLIASGEKLNDLLGQFGYMEIGSIACLLQDQSGGVPDPHKDTLDSFEIVWGDRLFPQGR